MNHLLPLVLLGFVLGVLVGVWFATSRFKADRIASARVSVERKNQWNS